MAKRPQDSKLYPSNMRGFLSKIFLDSCRMALVEQPIESKMVWILTLQTMKWPTTLYLKFRLVRIYVPCLRGPQLNMTVFIITNFFRSLVKEVNGRFSLRCEHIQREHLTWQKPYEDYFSSVRTGLKESQKCFRYLHQYGNANSNIISKIVFLCVFWKH